MVPMQCEYYALEGLSALVQTIEQIKTSINSDLEIEGLLRTMFDPRNNLANAVSAQLIEHFGNKVFRTLIPRNIRLAEAPSFGKPALFHDKESRGALAYLALAGEMIRRDESPDAIDALDANEAADAPATSEVPVTPEAHATRAGPPTSEPQSMPEAPAEAPSGQEPPMSGSYPAAAPDPDGTPPSSSAADSPETPEAPVTSV